MDRGLWRWFYNLLGDYFNLDLHFPFEVQKIWISGSVEGSYSNGGEYIYRATNLTTRQACKVDVLVFKKLVV